MHIIVEKSQSFKYFAVSHTEKVITGISYLNHLTHIAQSFSNGKY